MYISRIRPHDADLKRRQYALNRAYFLEGQRKVFIDWCLHQRHITQEQMEEDLGQLDEIIATWRHVADQYKID